MGEADEDKSLPSGASIDNDAASPVPATTFKPGAIWKLMGTFWKFPDWHWAWLRGEKKGLFSYEKIGAKQPEAVLAAQTLDELRGLILAVVSCRRLYRHDIAERTGGFKAAGLAFQSILSINRRSLSLHDRVSLLPSLSGLLEHDCIICSIFHTVRRFVSTQPPADAYGMPNGWEMSVIEGGDNALLYLFRHLESAGQESTGLSVSDLKRHTTFIMGLLNLARPVAAVNNAATPNQHGVEASTVVKPEAAVTGSTAESETDRRTEESEKANAANLMPDPATNETGKEDSGLHPETPGNHDGMSVEAVASNAVGQTVKKGRKGYRTTALMQYYTLRVLFEQYRADSVVSIKAGELCKRIQDMQRGDRVVVGLDETYCHAAINDLRKRFQRDCPEIKISKGKYLLQFGHYARKSDVEKMIVALKTDTES